MECRFRGVRIVDRHIRAEGCTERCIPATDIARPDYPHALAGDGATGEAVIVPELGTTVCERAVTTTRRVIPDAQVGLHRLMQLRDATQPGQRECEGIFGHRLPPEPFGGVGVVPDAGRGEDRGEILGDP